MSENPSVQLSLPGAAEMFGAVGLDSLPHGAADMNGRQLRFCLAYLASGSASQAARETGYSDVDGHKILRRAKVSRFLSAAVKPVAQNGDQLVRRKWELSVSLHHELMQLRGIAPEKKTAAEMKRERQLVRMVNQTDMLLAAMLNRLGIKLTGEVTVQHTGGGDFIVVPPDALPGMARARQEVVTDLARLQGGLN